MHNESQKVLADKEVGKRANEYVNRFGLNFVEAIVRVLREDEDLALKYLDPGVALKTYKDSRPLYFTVAEKDLGGQALEIMHREKIQFKDAFCRVLRQPKNAVVATAYIRGPRPRQRGR